MNLLIAFACGLFTIWDVLILWHGWPRNFRGKEKTAGFFRHPLPTLFPGGMTRPSRESLPQLKTEN